MLSFALANKDSDEDDDVGDALARMDVAELGRASLLASQFTLGGKFYLQLNPFRTVPL